jgi:hypothetical protein
MGGGSDGQARRQPLTTRVDRQTRERHVPTQFTRCSLKGAARTVDAARVQGRETLIARYRDWIATIGLYLDVV